MEACETAGSIQNRMLDLFPYAQLRKGQDRFLEDARACFAGRTHLLAHAPTGLGKTAVSLAAGLESSLEAGFLFFLTARQSQHAVAIETLRHIWRKRSISVVDLVAREDMCLSKRRNGTMPCLEGDPCYFLARGPEEAVDRMLGYPMHVQESMRLCLRLGTCPYLAAVKALERAEVAVADYNQVFLAERNSMLSRTGRKGAETILIVDEAHNLPTRLMDNHSAALTEQRIMKASNSATFRAFHDDLEVLRACFLRLTKGGERTHLEPWELDEALEQRCGTDSGRLADEMHSNLKEAELRKHRELLEFLACWSAFGESSARFSSRSPPTLNCRLLEPSLVAAPTFDQVHSALLMSGTLHPPEMFADLLGITERCACRKYASPFPLENRLIIGVFGVTSRFSERSERMYAAMGQRIAEVCSSTPGNVAAFFPSYDFMNRVLFQMKGSALPKRMITESREFTKNERDAILEDLRRSRDAVLMATMGGSFSEGVDFKDNLLSAVVVAGLPLSPPSPELDARQMRLERKFGGRKAKLYAQTYPALSKVLQAAGRAIRGEQDRAAIVLLDERYMLPSITNAFPEDFRPRTASDLRAALDSFFQRADGKAQA